mgnify:CR=1 FL=1
MTRLCLAIEIFLLVNIVAYVLIILLDVYLNGEEAWGHKETASVHWCEAVDRLRFVRAPFTAYSSLAFVTVGIAVLCIALVYEHTDKQNHLRRRLWLINGVQGAVLLGAGTCLFVSHASARDDLVVLERVVVWPVVLVPVSLAALRLVRVPAPMWGYVLWACLLAAFAIGFAGISSIPSASSFVVAAVPTATLLIFVLLLVKLISECYNRVRFSESSLYPLVIALVFAVISFVLQWPEVVDPGENDDECDVHSPWFRKMRGWYHTGLAVTLFLLWWWLFFESSSDQPYFLAVLPSREGDWRRSWRVALPLLPLLPLKDQNEVQDGV